MHIQSRVRRFTHIASIFLRMGKRNSAQRLEGTIEANKTSDQLLRDNSQSKQRNTDLKKKKINLYWTQDTRRMFFADRQQQITSINQRSAKNVGELKNNMEELRSTNIKNSSCTKEFRGRSPTQSSDIHRSVGCTVNTR